MVSGKNIVGNVFGGTQRRVLVPGTGTVVTEPFEAVASSFPEAAQVPISITNKI